MFKLFQQSGDSYRIYSQTQNKQSYRDLYGKKWILPEIFQYTYNTDREQQCSYANGSIELDEEAFGGADGCISL